GDWVCLAISADTMKMPEPIIEPMTSVVESNSPRPATRRVALALLMTPYCTLPILHALADGSGGAIGGQQVADNGDGICSRFERGSSILARDATDRHQRPGCQPAPRAQPVEAHHGIRIELRLCREHRTERQVINRLAGGCD